MDPNLLNTVVNEPLFEPTFVNPDYFYGNILSFIQNPDLWRVAGAIRFLSYLLTLFGITIILYSIVRIVEIRSDMRKKLQEDIRQALEKKKQHAAVIGNPVWEGIENLINSPNPGDWRLAIIEADRVLDGLLTEKGYSGATFAEKMQNAGSGAFVNYNRAWEAHKVRNKIAHEGSDYTLTEREAKDAIRGFEATFREFHFI